MNDTAPMRVLVVDDEPTVSKLLTAFLGQCTEPTVQPTAVASYDEAKQAILGGGFDMALIDYHLWSADESGLDLIKLAHSTEHALATVLITGSEQDDIDLHAMKIGADDFLPKQQISLEEVTRIVRYVTYRKKNRELQQRLESLTQTRRSISGILSALSHEIRNNLGGILLQARVSKSMLDATGSEAMSAIEQTAGELLITSENILESTRLEQNATNLHPTRFQVDTEISDAIELIEPLVEQCDSTIVRDCKLTDPHLTGDQRLFRRLIGNLLLNAAKHGGGQVRLTARNNSANGSLDLLVSDQGAGIAEDRFGRLGHPFTLHSGQESAEHADGFGLGLYVCRLIVGHFQGRMRLRSAPECGTAIQLTFDTRGARPMVNDIKPVPLECGLGDPADWLEQMQEAP